MLIAIGQAFSGKPSAEWYEAVTDNEKEAAKFVSTFKKRTDLASLRRDIKIAKKEG